MTPSDFIVDVSEADFEYEVLSYSQNVPVVVDFWATWCQPCKTLGPMLERLTEEAGGVLPPGAGKRGRATPTWRCATACAASPPSRQSARDRWSASLPVCSRKRACAISWQNWPHPVKARWPKRKPTACWPNTAGPKRKQILPQTGRTNPEPAAGAAWAGKNLLAQGKSGEALFILNYFPASREYNAAQFLRPLAEAMMKYEKNELPDENELDAMFRNSIRLAKRGNQLAALDGLLDIIRQEKRYRSDQSPPGLPGHPRAAWCGRRGCKAVPQ